MAELAEIPGVQRLWELTRGDAGIGIALLDGRADVAHPCFAGAALEVREPYWLTGRDSELEFSRHATGVASILFGQPGTEVEGIAPRCRGFNVPAGVDAESYSSPLDLARGLDLALDTEARIIHVAHCLPTESGAAYEMVARGIRKCLDAGRLVVAPAGNDRGECWCEPALEPGVLVVGAYNDEGRAFRFSNYGSLYEGRGVLAPGEAVLCAEAGGGTKRHKGTSVAAPIVSGLAALLLAVQKLRGEPLDPQRVGRAILDSALPSEDPDPEERRRWLNGKLNIAGAMRLLFGDAAEPLDEKLEEKPVASISAAMRPAAAEGVSAGDCPTPSPLPRGRRVFALGRIGYDFGSETSRKAFRERMPRQPDGQPGEPDDARQLAGHLAARPDDARSLSWTFRQEPATLYVIDPRGPFGADVHEMLIALLAAQAAPAESEERVDVVSLPGMVTGRTAVLESGEALPVVALASLRSFYGWQVEVLVEAALQSTRDEYPATDEDAVRSALRRFLHRVYYDLRNGGATSPNRALNFAATNAFQAAACCADAVSRGRHLIEVGVEKSRFCRPGSDCWDVLLTFYDPDQGTRARRLYRFTIDVSDATPVTLGRVRSWALARRASAHSSSA